MEYRIVCHQRRCDSPYYSVPVSHQLDANTIKMALVPELSPCGTQQQTRKIRYNTYKLYNTPKYNYISKHKKTLL